jgi:hypothetical protein
MGFLQWGRAYGPPLGRRSAVPVVRIKPRVGTVNSDTAPAPTESSGTGWWANCSPRATGPGRRATSPPPGGLERATHLLADSGRSLSPGFGSSTAVHSTAAGGAGPRHTGLIPGRQAALAGHARAEPELLGQVLPLRSFSVAAPRSGRRRRFDIIRFGLHRALRKIPHDFSRATPRSTGARAEDSARLTVCCVGMRSRPGGRLRAVVTHGPPPI